jgi:hypothetical protein
MATTLLIALASATAATAQSTATRQSQTARIVVLEGEDAVNIIQQKTAVAPIVEVRDRNDLPVAGVPVTFTIAGGNTASFAGGAKAITVTTNAAGRAVASGLTPLTNGAVQIQAAATVQGQAVTATIAQTNYATAAQAAAAGGSAGSGGSGSSAGPSGGGFPTGTVIGLAGAAAGGVVGYQLYQKYGPSSGSSCSSSIEPSVAGPIPAAGGTFAFTTTETCAFRVTTDVPWITLSVNSSQVFQPQTLTFNFTVAPNAGPARSGTIYIENADGTGGSGWGVSQAAGSTGVFRASRPSTTLVSMTSEADCDATLVLSHIDATLARDAHALTQGLLRVTMSTSGANCATHGPGIAEYGLIAGSLSDRTVVLRFRAASVGHPLSFASFEGLLSEDGHSIAGDLRLHDSGAAVVVMPLTFRQIH